MRLALAMKPGTMGLVNRRHILVTGTNGGLGQAIGRAFLEESTENFLWLGVRKNRDLADQLAGAFEGRCEVVPLEVTAPEAWRKVVERILDREEGLEVLVNNAGHHQDSLLGTMPPEMWREVLDINLNSVFLGCQTVLPTMVSQRKGRIVNMASLSALLAPAGQTNYAAAKAGVVALTQSLAKEVARIGITVNAVCPGYIETAALSALSTDQRQQLQNRVPMRRFGQPEEVAAAVVFLARPEAAYVTGSVLKVDGGIL